VVVHRSDLGAVPPVQELDLLLEQHHLSTVGPADEAELVIGLPWAVPSDGLQDADGGGMVLEDVAFALVVGVPEVPVFDGAVGASREEGSALDGGQSSDALLPVLYLAPWHLHAPIPTSPIILMPT
jgi:hypothetical protein